MIIAEIPKEHRSQFRKLWKDNATRYDFYDLARKIKPDLSWDEFNWGWQWRTILHSSYAQARREFIMVLNGTG